MPFEASEICFEEFFSPSNIKSTADISLSQLIGLRHEFESAKEEALGEQQLHISVVNDGQRRRLQQLELVVRAQRGNIGRSTEHLDKQRRLVKSDRNKSRTTEKMIRDS